jgi:SAM-dependent methyltransferase
MDVIEKGQGDDPARAHSSFLQASSSPSEAETAGATSDHGRFRKTLLGRRDRMTPPARLREAVGGGDFRAIGEEFVGLYVEHARLRPEDRILDVGCGVGRMAIPLTRYLTTGSYEGFDVSREAIDWCKKVITRRFPNFRFQHADVHNAAYNPAGRTRPTEFSFPYSADSFDLVTLASVFTHMLPEAVDQYLSEVARVLRSGGTVFATWFLLNDESRELVKVAPPPDLDFRYGEGVFRTTNSKHPESAVAYDERWVRDVYQQHGLELKQPILHGSWPGRSGVLFQDIVVAFTVPSS